MKIDPIQQMRNQITDSTYVVGSGFAAHLAEAMRKLEAEDREESKRIVESSEGSSGVDYKA